MGAEGTLQNFLNPEILADKLCNKGLPSPVKTINIISSDLKSPISLYEFGSTLAGVFKDKYYRNIQVRVTSDIRSDITLVIPPLNN